MRTDGVIDRFERAERDPAGLMAGKGLAETGYIERLHGSRWYQAL